KTPALPALAVPPPVVPAQTPPAVKPAANSAQQKNPSVNPQDVPPGVLWIDSMPFVVPAGFMGDATVQNGQTSSLIGGADCHWNHGCYRVEFKPGKQEW